MRYSLVVLLIAIGVCGCNHGNIGTGSFLHHRNKEDTLKREYVPTCNQPILEAARAVTKFEDALRRDGTVTVKTPDVWGDSNLMHSIQEFDTELKRTLGEFDETLQGTVVVTDAAGFASELAAKIGIDGAVAADPPAKTLELPPAQAPFTALASVSSVAPGDGKLRLEPTQRERQHSTYVSVNQALRRRAMGGDNTRKAGYGLYLFRIPVSVLPGEETSQGFSAVANIRARMVTTQADVKYTLPRMAIADLVEALTEGILKNWKAPSRDVELKNAITKFRKKAKLECNSGLVHVEAKLKNLEAEQAKLSDEQLRARISEINLIYQKIDVLSKEVLSLQSEDLITEEEAEEMLAILCLDASEIDSWDAISGVESRIGYKNDFSKVILESESLTAGDETKTLQSLLVALNPTLSEKQLSQYRENIPELTDWAERWQNKSSSSNIPQGNRLPTAKLFSPVESTVFDPMVLDPSPDVQAQATGIAQLSVADIENQDIIAVRDSLKSRFKLRLDSKPLAHELRTMLFDHLTQINIQLEKLSAYDIFSVKGDNAIQLAAIGLESGKSISDIAVDWRTQLKDLNPDAKHTYLRTAWLLARQCGLVDLNIKRMLREMQLRGDVPESVVCSAEFINFFGQNDLAEAQRIWQLIVETEFPLQVFTLEPLVEEQNLLDASSRLREMQIALAYSVAQGSWNVSQRVDMARQLAQESAAIGLNRTVVGFAHGSDTFGWYFYPRLQSPEAETSNISVLGKLCKSTGPTRRDDAQTYRLEPGIRECEVLVAMPSFVSQVEFDVTTNWESLADPGRSKRSYEELIREGCDLQKMMACLDATVCGPECRPGDFARLYSRAEQLSNMLGMQTHRVNVPFEYDQPATELFDQGDKELVPSVNGYYGLSQLVAKDDSQYVTADFFITGRNFHPTLTHVIVGGHESHSDQSDTTAIEILSRELIRVKTRLKTEKLSGETFEVRVGTPGGLSNPLSIAKEKKKPTPPSSAFDWEVQPKFTAEVTKKKSEPKQVNVNLVADNPESEFKIKSSKDNLIQITQEVKKRGGLYRNADLVFADNEQGFELRIVYEATFNDKTNRTINGIPKLYKFTEPVTKKQLQAKIQEDLEVDNDPEIGLRPTDPNKGIIKGTTYLRLGNWPLIKLDTPILIELK